MAPRQCIAIELMSYTAIRIESRPGIEIVELHRPDALNSLDPAMVDELTAYLEDLHGRTEVRVVILRGAGRVFCAGLDLTAWNIEKSGGERVQSRFDTQRRIARLVALMRSCPQPIIALGHGAACGGGFSLLLAADVRIGAPSLRMNAAYIKIGLGGCDIGASYFLPRLIGASAASEYLLTGRFMDADTALGNGLLSRICAEEDLLDQGLALADEMLATAPMGLRLTKEALNINIDASSLFAATALEDRQQVMMLNTRDHQEAIAAFLEKREPRYRDE